MYNEDLSTFKSTQNLPSSARAALSIECSYPHLCTDIWATYHPVFDSAGRHWNLDPDPTEWHTRRLVCRYDEQDIEYGRLAIFLVPSYSDKNDLELDRC